MINIDAPATQCFMIFTSVNYFIARHCIMHFLVLLIFFLIFKPASLSYCFKYQEVPWRKYPERLKIKEDKINVNF